MQTGNELFIYELSDMLDAERQLVEALRRLEDDSSNPQLKQAFAAHGRQTEGHVQRLEQCFDLLDAEPRDAQCAGIHGLIQEKSEFMDENPEADILDVFHVGAAQKVENYEICAYQSLIIMAEEMDHKRVVRLLNANLKEENSALKKMQGFEKKIKPSRMMEEEEEEEAAGREAGGEENESGQTGRGRRTQGSVRSRAGRGRRSRRAA